MDIDIGKLSIDEITLKKEEVTKHLFEFRKQIRDLRDLFYKKEIEIEKAIADEQERVNARDAASSFEKEGDQSQEIVFDKEQTEIIPKEAILSEELEDKLDTSLISSKRDEPIDYIAQKEDPVKLFETEANFPDFTKPASYGGKSRGGYKRGRNISEDTYESPKGQKRRSNANINVGLMYDEEDTRVIKVRKPKRKTSEGFNITAKKVIGHAILDKSIITVKELADKIGKSGIDILKKLHSIDIIKSINETIDFSTAELIASEFGITLELQEAKTSEDIINEMHIIDEDDEKDLVPRPPVVTIMGHVDHGKTSLLDYIREAHVASGEAGKITQHIGAYSVKVDEQQITFIDTPGHAAFTQLRERGAKVTDIVIIVVAADDGVKPQTIEAINHSKVANANIIVAVNKIDKADVDIDKIFDQLSRYDVLVEEWGGNIPCVKVSAKTGEGVSLLLETILVVAELLDLKANPARQGRGTVIEAKIDPRKGAVATVIVENGTLKVGDFIVAGTIVGKIRAMYDDQGETVMHAGPSDAVAILGLKDLPNAGDSLLAADSERLTKQVANDRISKEKSSIAGIKQVSLADLYKSLKDEEDTNLNIIIKGDVQGSVEALSASLKKLSNEEVKVNILHAVPGSINESDISLAKTTNSIIIGFNVRPDARAKALADSLLIDIKLYRIIYDAIDDVQNAINGLLKPIIREEYLGKAEVLKIYKIPGLGNIAGCIVRDGKIVRNANVRLIRDDIIIADSMISSLKRFEDDVKDVLTGFECGIGLKGFNNFIEGDIIESFNLVETSVSKT